LSAAEHDLLEKGYGDSLLKLLLKNETRYKEDIGWEAVRSVRARFQVTFIPDKQHDVSAPADHLLQNIYVEASMECPPMRHNKQAPWRENAATSNGDPSEKSASSKSSVFSMFDDAIESMNARCCSEIDSQLHFTTLFFPQTDY
jgi:hypothetical protein